MLVAPVKVLTPVRLSVPAPDLASVAAPPARLAVTVTVPDALLTV